MSDSIEPRKREAASTYFVQDRNRKDELQRLRLQDQMVTAAMAGVLRPGGTNRKAATHKDCKPEATTILQLNNPCPT